LIYGVTHLMVERETVMLICQAIKIINLLYIMNVLIATKTTFFIPCQEIFFDLSRHTTQFRKICLENICFYDLHHLW